MFVAALLKGAALNAVQIAELLLERVMARADVAGLVDGLSRGPTHLRLPIGLAAKQEARIAIRIKPVALLDRMRIGLLHGVEPCKG